MDEHALFSNAVESQQQFLHADVNQAGRLHVAFGISAQYALGMGVAVLSLLANNPGRALAVHVFSDSILPVDVERLASMAAEHRVDCHVHRIRPSTFASLKTVGGFPPAVYNRLLVANQLKGIASEVLYLDADLVCLAPVQGLALNGQMIAAVSDSAEQVAANVARLGLQHGRYFNSGVMLIDIDRWHAEQVSERTVKVLGELGDKLLYLDQDALNVVLDGQVNFVEPRWNDQYNLYTMTHPVPSDTIFLHYFCGCKPWFEWCEHPAQSHFLRYYRQSLWRDVPFELPRNHHEMKSYAKTLFIRRQYLTGLIWYARYASASLRKKLAR